MLEDPPELGDVHSPTPYLWQVARAYRFFHRYSEARAAGTRFEATGWNDIEDFMWAFFQNAWHIKDWLKNDPTLNDVLKQVLMSEIHGTESLLLCADLANGSKHFGSDPDRDKIGATDQQIELSCTTGGVTITDHIIVTGNGKRLTALALARWVLNDWRDLLVRHKLVSPSTAAV